jgi:hypothetical protein
MLLIKPRRAHALTPMLLLALLAGCGSVSPPSRPTPGPAIPPLPAQARQTDSATHSQRAQVDIETWLQPQTAPSSPARPASGPTTR